MKLNHILTNEQIFSEQCSVVCVTTWYAVTTSGFQLLSLPLTTMFYIMIMLYS